MVWIHSISHISLSLVTPFKEKKKDLVLFFNINPKEINAIKGLIL
jgi:hypothetical protein